MAAMTSTFDGIAKNSKAHHETFVCQFLKSFVKIGFEVLSNDSGHTHRADTHTSNDRQTDRQTDTQTTTVFSPERITIQLVNKMTKCKNNK